MSVSLTQLKRRVESDLPDSTLQMILDAEAEAVEREAGAASVVETHLASGARKLMLRNRPSSVDVVKERRTLDDDETTLSSNDYRLIGNSLLYREGDGSEPQHTWGAEVIVEYTREIDTKVRDRVTLDLCQLSIEFRAYEVETVGDWEGDQKQYESRRQSLLKQIREPRSLLV